jgi:hypothetical protein
MLAEAVTVGDMVEVRVGSDAAQQNLQSVPGPRYEVYIAKNQYWLPVWAQRQISLFPPLIGRVKLFFCYHINCFFYNSKLPKFPSKKRPIA